MRNYVLGFVLVFFLGGCATTQTFEYVRVHTETQLVTFPPLNSESEAEVGQSMVQAARKTVTPAIKVTEEITHQLPNSTKDALAKIIPSQLPLFSTDQNGAYYRAARTSSSVYDVLGNDTGGIAGVYVPNNEPTLTQVFWHWSSDGNRGSISPHPGIKYETTVIEEWGTDSFKRELVYQGVSQNTVSIRYREFNKDMARPAFTEDLKYDLSQGDVIGYKGARFQIFKANNLSIRYKVLKPLD